jgi:pimeloyl-ACP methyl ester carboxylesterase
MVERMGGFKREVLEVIPVDAAGTTLDSWVFRRAPLGPAAPTLRLVILHGLGDAPVAWFPALRDAFPDAELVLPALPGAGRGPLPKGHDHLGFAATAAWTQQVLHRLVTDGPKTVLVGHSMGGWFVARALLSDPSLAARAGPPILVNTAGTWYDGVERERDLLSPKTLEDVDELTMHLYAREPDLPVEALAALLETMKDPSYQGLLWSTRIEDFLTGEELARLPRGTGLIWGTADRLVPPEAFDRLKRHLVDPRIVPIDGVGHAPHIEAPKRLVDAMTRLLE